MKKPVPAAMGESAAIGELESEFEPNLNIQVILEVQIRKRRRLHIFRHFSVHLNPNASTRL